MDSILKLTGWAAIIMLVILFADVVGVIRSRVYKERSVKAEFTQKNLWLKIAFFGLFVVAYFLQ